eukprot:6174052-Pleurochrysis_carterae.AAC.1
MREQPGRLSKLRRSHLSALPSNSRTSPSTLFMTTSYSSRSLGPSARAQVKWIPEENTRAVAFRPALHPAPHPRASCSHQR